MATFAELITQAKTLVPPKLTDDDPLMETAWNKLIDLMTHYNSQILTKLDSLIPPVGFIYIQLPGTPDPAALWDNPDSRWENVSSRFPGAFFRAEGGAASAFNASSTSPAFAAGDSGTTGGQSSGAPNITGAFKHGKWGSGTSSGAFYASGSASQSEYGASSTYQGDSKSLFDASRSSTVYGSSPSEVRPKNITIRVWRRKA